MLRKSSLAAAALSIALVAPSLAHADPWGGGPYWGRHHHHGPYWSGWGSGRYWGGAWRPYGAGPCWRPGYYGGWVWVCS